MDLKQYQAEAQNTKSNAFYGDAVALNVFIQRVKSAIVALHDLDEIKKALFYGKSYSHLIEGRRLNCNNLQLHNLSDNVDKGIDLLHAIIGKATEAGELLEALYKSTIDNHPIDRTNVMEEIGDGFWYDAIALTAIDEHDSGFEQCAALNNAKLRKRFPNKFTETDAINRDLPAERKVLETDIGRHIDDEEVYD